MPAFPRWAGLFGQKKVYQSGQKKDLDLQYKQSLLNHLSQCQQAIVVGLLLAEAELGLFLAKGLSRKDVYNNKVIYGRKKDSDICKNGKQAFI